jgi:hypothetical protein
MKAVSDRALREQVARPGWIGLKLTPELLDHHTDVFDVAGSIALPNVLRQVLMSARLAGVLTQILQDQKLFRSQMAHAAFGTVDLMRLQIDGTIL